MLRSFLQSSQQQSNFALLVFVLIPFVVLAVIGVFFLGILVENLENKAQGNCTISTQEKQRPSLKDVPAQYHEDIYKAAKTAGIPATILAAQLEQESQWNPKAKSQVGAQGLAQFTPGTWKIHGQGDPYNPANAIAAQGRYMKVLKDMAEKIPGDTVDLALAGYNAGEGAVQQYDGVPPYPETQEYVKKIKANAVVNYGAQCID